MGPGLGSGLREHMSAGVRMQCWNEEAGKNLGSGERMKSVAQNRLIKEHLIGLSWSPSG